MACSDPNKLYPQDIKTRFNSRPVDYRRWAEHLSFGYHDYFKIPCGVCLNCRVDKQNSLVDRCEYEFMEQGSGAFVTFTYDDIHLHKNAFFDTKKGCICHTINRKDGKDFLNRLNKEVHKFVKKFGNSGACNKNYKYVLTGEYGDRFKRPHFHALFFGLDFKICERLFWRAWNFQGSIDVGPIRSGGIKYATKYISSIEFGPVARAKYTYHHLEKPYSVHSQGLGEGLYKSQLRYIREHHGNYRWHGKDRPLPSYYKKKYLITSDLDLKWRNFEYKKKKRRIESLYEHKITSYKAMEEYTLMISRRRMENLKNHLIQSGKTILDMDQLQGELKDFQYNSLIDSDYRKTTWLCRVVYPDGTYYARTGRSRYKRYNI